MSRSIIRFLPLAALAVVLSAVFVVDDFLWEGVVTAKYFWFAGAMCVAVPAVFSALFILSRGKRGILRRTDVLALLSATYAIVNYGILNGWPDMRFWLFLLMIPLYATVRAVCEDETLRRQLPAIVLLVVLSEAILGLMQLYGFARSHHGLYRITGSLFNPGPYSGFIAAGVPLALGYALNKKLPEAERGAGIITLIAALLVLPAAMSRAAWLAALAGSIPVLRHHLPASVVSRSAKYFRQRSVRIATIVMLCVSIVGLSAGLYYLKKDSADGRRVIWSASMNLVKERPLFGAGFDRFSAVYGDAQAAYFLDGEGTEAQSLVADSPDYAFNEYIQTAVELGLVGLVLFLLTICSLFFRSHLLPLTSSLIALLVFAAFSYPFGVLPLSILFVFLLAASASSSPKLRFAIPAPLQISGIILCLCITAYGAYRILPLHTAYREFSTSQMFYRAEAYNEAEKSYRALYPLLKHEKQFLFEYGQCLSKTERYEESNRVFEQFLHYACDPMVYNCMGNNYKAMKDYAAAEAAYTKASQIVPNRHYPLYLLMKLYQETGQTERARITAEVLLNKPVKVKSTAIREMQEEAKEIRGF